MLKASPGAFQRGVLVALREGPNLVPVGPNGEPAGEAVDVTGTFAQLLDPHGDASWLLCTLDAGALLRAPAERLRPISPDEFRGLGASLVLGPGSSLSGVGASIVSLFLEQGFACLHAVVAHGDLEAMVNTADALDRGRLLHRLPGEFEAGFLGKGGRAKVGVLEGVEWGGSEAFAAAVGQQARAFTELCSALSPLTQEALGFSLHDRTCLMLRMPLVGDEDEAAYPAAAVDARQAHDFLSLMGRKRVCALLCLGPGESAVSLVSRAGEFPEARVAMRRGRLLLFLTDHFEHEHECLGAGPCVLLQAFLLEPPLQFAFQGLERDVKLSPEDLPPATGPGLPAGEPVCVFGLASRDPCCVDDHEKLWTALRHGGCDGFLEIPSARFDLDLYVQYDDQQAAVMSGKSYCRHQGHVEGVEIFDAAFFNIPAAEAHGMDPEQRLTLETGWSAMSEAGYDRKRVQKESAHLGVFVGISGSDWRDVCRMPSANGVPETFIANRFSYVVNLKGPSFISNTACSASLVATHSAKVHLLFPTDPLDGCVIAGISLNTSPGTWVGNCAGNMLSFTGRSFTFNASADGYGRGEGCAAAVIKRAEYEPTDPQTQALLAGTHTNSDGRSASLTAPNGPAQQRLLRAILTETELEASEICVYEAHGTGTSLGDPIEVGAVRKVLTQRAYPLMVSCSKTNLGHLEGGAGLSAFCKCVMACMHTECAPNQHLNLLNPHLDIDGWPSLMLTEAQPMRGDTTYVGVSGFGYGGTNSHALAYGRNVLTSRGCANPKYVQTALLRKVKGAPPPEVTFQGETYEDWATAGPPHLSRDPNLRYRVELLEDGHAAWREVLEADLSEVEDFQIQGSFTGWELRGLKPSMEEPRLWHFRLEIGPSGEETFQIAVDYDPYMLLYPERQRCTSKAVQILGPDAAPSREHAWLIRGTPGARYQVEMFQSGSTTAVTWREMNEEARIQQLTGMEDIQE